MLVWNGQLVNLGSYNNPCNRVSIWDGTNWSCLGGGVGIVARAGCIWNGNLVVVGDFWNNFQPCVGCNGVAMWDGTQWTAFDNGFNNDVLTCTVFNGDLIIGGDFTQADGVPISRVAKWNTTTQEFESMGAVTDFDNDVRCMTEFDGELWVGGDFNNVGGNSPSDGLVKWDETTSTWIGGNFGVDLVGGVNETVRVLYVNPNDGNLYMGGEFPELIDGNAGVVDFNMSGIAMYDGSDWSPLGTGLNEYCRAIHEYNGNLIAGGYFTTAGGVACNKIAKWNGATWSPMGLGFDGGGIDEYVKSATVWNGIFFAGGAYTQAEGGPMNYIAQWYEAPTGPPTANINASTNAVCEGNCINFSDLSTNNPTSWTWSFPGASTSSSTAQNPGNICYPNAGSYTASLTACNSNGCTTSDFNVTINGAPTLSVSNNTICEGESTSITATPSITGGDYNWTTTGETTQSITVAPTTTTTYDVEYTLNGCPSAIQTSTISVNPVPTITVNSETICAGASVSLSATPSISGGSYNWITTGDNTQSILVSPTSTSAYQVEYTLNGCTSATEISNVVVNASYSFNESMAVCIGESVTFPNGNTAVITASTNYVSNLQTFLGCDSIINTSVNVLPDFNTSQALSLCTGSSYTYPDGTTETNITTNVSQTSNLSTVNGCDSIITTNITVLNEYSTNEDVDVCFGDSYTYPDGTVETNIMTNTSHISSLFSVNGCDSIVTTNIGLITTNVNTSEANNIISAQQVGAIYQWIDCGTNTPIAGETSQSFAPNYNGDFAVIVTFDGCSDTSNCTTISTVSIEDLSINEITLYPVPADGSITIKGQLPNKTVYQILDLSGATILEGELNAQQTISILALSPGTYFVHLQHYGILRMTKI